ncbi:MAG: TonB-dependent receptor [Planctomycetes bacterium]|nr:TonB-dependent receptor [Planctomycetota bacterium]
MMAVCMCVVLACGALRDSQAWGQQVPPLPPPSPTLRQASVTQNVAADDVLDDLNDILSLADESLESLAKADVVVPGMDMEVSTVSRTESTVGRSPAAVFVITNEMIRRSGARNIPDVLRMAPGLQVARIDANKWAVSARGFNGYFANKLLVQIDGRSVYTPLYAGVYWDVQELVLDDIERIEVVRGPGAAVWGANAVNGVINIITKDARETQGSLVQGGAGTEERGFTTVRVGGRLGDDAHYRVYGKWFERDRGFMPTGNAPDDWRQGRAGFRIDFGPTCCDTITLQGDYYNGTSGNRNLLPGFTPPDFATTYDEDADISGGNVLLRWSRVLDERSDWSVQFYYDRTCREMMGSGFGEDRDTIDLDFQHRFPLAERHSLIWGFGYRNTKDTIQSVPFYLTFDPNQRADDLFSYFVQDEITLREDQLYLTVGSKFEHNDYTGFEYQPTGRLLWTPSPRHSIWTSISRAVRTPSRAEDDVQIAGSPVAILPPPPVPVPIFPLLTGSRGLQAEDLLAYEAGIRVQPTDAFYWDLAVFFNTYDDLIAVAPGMPVPGTTPVGWPALFVPGQGANLMDAETYGVELAASYELNPCWRVHGAYTLLRMALRTDPGIQPLARNGENPRNQFYLALSGDLDHDLQLDLIGRYTDSLPAMGVPSYVVMDARVAWHASPNLEMFVVGRNLLDQEHPEFGSDALTGAVGTEVQHEVYGGLTWRY